MRACASLPQIAAHLVELLDHACNDALLPRPNSSKSKLHAQMKGLLSIGDSSPAENQPFLRDQGTWMTQRKHESFTYRVVRSNEPRAHKQCACSQHHAGSRLALPGHDRTAGPMHSALHEGAHEQRCAEGFTCQQRVQMMMGLTKLTALLCYGGIIAIAAFKDTHGGHHFVLNRGYHIASCCIAALLLAGLSALLGNTLWRTLVSVRLQRRWSGRRKAVVRRTTARTLVTAFVLLTWLIGSVSRAIDPEIFCSPSELTTVTDFLHWSGWNTLLLLVLIDGHGTNLVDIPGREDGTVRDKPLWWHWPKLSLWLVGEGAQPVLGPAQRGDTWRSCLVSLRNSSKH